MNSLKTMFLAVLMSAATYGVYVTITGNPPGPPPKGVSDDWRAEEPKVEIPATDAAPTAGGVASGGPNSGDSGYKPTPLASDTPNAPADERYHPGKAMPYDPRGTGQDPRVAARNQADSSDAYPDTHPDQFPPIDAPDKADPAVAGGKPSGSLAGASGRYPSGSPDDRRPSGRDPAAERHGSERNGADRYGAERYPADDRQAFPEHQRSPERSLSTPSRPSTGALDEADGQDSDPAEVHDDFVASIRAAESMLADNQLVEALLELSPIVGVPLTNEDEAQLMELVDQLAGTVIYSREHMLDPPYEVQPGDTLERIADDYQVPWQFLANINGITDPRRQLRPGDTLKVIKGPFDAVVDLNRFRLTLFVRNCYAGCFTIGTGKDCTTPEGDFEVQRKLVNPDYYGPGETIDKDSPDNPLGEFALELGDHIYIHGTNDPASIGRAVSKGCIRLSSRDIADVFAILTARTERSPGSVVRILR